MHEELGQGLQPKEDRDLLRLWTGAQPGRHGGQSAGGRVGSSLLLRVRVMGARVRSRDGVRGAGQLDPGKGAANSTLPPTRRNSCCCRCRQHTRKSCGIRFPAWVILPLPDRCLPG